MKLKLPKPDTGIFWTFLTLLFWLLFGALIVTVVALSLLVAAGGGR